MAQLPKIPTLTLWGPAICRVVFRVFVEFRVYVGFKVSGVFGFRAYLRFRVRFFFRVWGLFRFREGPQSGTHFSLLGSCAETTWECVGYIRTIYALHQYLV